MDEKYRYYETLEKIDEVVKNSLDPEDPYDKPIPIIVGITEIDDEGTVVHRKDAEFLARDGFVDMTVTNIGEIEELYDIEKNDKVSKYISELREDDKITVISLKEDAKLYLFWNKAALERNKSRM